MIDDSPSDNCDDLISHQYQIIIHPVTIAVFPTSFGSGSRSISEVTLVENENHSSMLNLNRKYSRTISL